MEVLTSNITSYPNNIESQNDIEIEYQNERGKPMPSLNHEIGRASCRERV